jgi:ribonucleoside-triphosphate reductase (thioredoxin)
LVQATHHRRFYLSEQFLDNYKGKQPEWGPVGYIVYKRTYARKKDDGSTEEFWETLKRVVEGVFNIQKDHVAKNGLRWDNPRSQKTAQEMYAAMWTFKFLPPGRSLWMMGSDYVQNRTAAGLYNCFGSETKVLTREGLKQIGNLAGTEQELMVSTGKWIKAPIHNFGPDNLFSVKISRGKKETKTIRATANHKWFAKEKYDDPFTVINTEHLKKGFRLQSFYGQSSKTTKPSPQGIAHGLVFGDGSCTKRVSRITLCGEKNRPLIKYFPLNDVSYTKEKDPVIIGMPAAYKAAPSFGESRKYLLGFLMGYFAADGSVSPQVTMSSTNKDNLILFKDIALICGINSYSITKENRLSNLTNKNSTLYKLTLDKKTLSPDFFLIEKHKSNFEEDYAKKKARKRKTDESWIVQKVSNLNIVEDVYCATVPEYENFILDGGILTHNCAFASTESIVDRGVEIFEFIMDALMLGVGVGFDTLGANKIKVKEPKETNGLVFDIPDSREGWVESVGLLLNAYFNGTAVPRFNYDLIRPFGEPIKGFGGTSSGPAPLQDLHKDIADLLKGRVDECLTSSDIVDIETFISKCVIAGNIRRSASLALGSPEDNEYLELKHDQKKLMSHRYASNNSVAAVVGMDYTKCVENTIKQGEPGYVWLDNARKYGRMGELKDDSYVMGVNPCSEQTLEHMELCCLVETFPARHDSYEEFKQTLKLAYLYGKSVTLTKTHWPETNARMLKNRRIGLSQTGIIQAFNRHGRREVLRWCDEGYKHIQELDKKFSDWLAIPRSIKTTSVKPSGSVSLLPQATPGIHYPEAEFYIRRIRFSINDPLLPALKKAGYHIEDDAYDSGRTTKVVDFPVQEKYFAKSKYDVSIWEQLENTAKYQQFWSDNSVSVTITFKPEEAGDIKNALELYEDRLKSVSFLPLSEHGYKQAPYEAIVDFYNCSKCGPIGVHSLTTDLKCNKCNTKAVFIKAETEYKKLKKNLKPIDFSKVVSEASGEKYCDGDTCQV